MQDCTICCKVLMQIREHIPLDTDILHVVGNAGRCDGIYPGGVIHEVHVKTGFFDFVLTQIPGKLVDNGRDHLKVCQFFCTGMLVMTAHRKPLQFCRFCGILVSESKMKHRKEKCECFKIR